MRLHIVPAEASSTAIGRAESLYQRTAARARNWDVRVTTGLIVTLVAIPSILVVGPLGAAGTPADLIGMYMLIYWVFGRIARPVRGQPLSPVRTAMIVFIASIVVSYLMASTRPISATELSAADRGLLVSLAWLGVVTFLVDAPRSLKDLDTILRRLVIAGAVEGMVGLTQYVSKLSLVDYIVIPGLSANSQLAATLASRGSFVRPAGTTIHPIEFGAVLTLILPIAMHYAVHDVDRLMWRRWLPVGIIAFAIPISISRSAVVSAVIALAFLLPAWPVQWRRRAYVAIAGLVGSVYLLVPGLLGTLRNLFLGISNDSSAASRTDSYGLAEQFIRQSPIFGRGFATFLPADRILDNQFLGITIETGLCGLAALLGLIIVSSTVCVRVRRRGMDERQGRLAQALMGSVAAAGVSFALYDAFSFPTAATLFFVVVGCAGALARLDRTAHRRRSCDAIVEPFPPVDG